MQPVPDEERDQSLWRQCRRAQRHAPDACITHDTLAAYLSRSLAAAALERVEGHLAACRPCAAAALDVCRLASAEPVALPPVLRRWATALVAPAAPPTAPAVVKWVRELAGRLPWGFRWSPVAALVMSVCVVGLWLGQAAAAEEHALWLTLTEELGALL